LEKEIEIRICCFGFDCGCGGKLIDECWGKYFTKETKEDSESAEIECELF